MRALTGDQLVEFAEVVGDRPVHAHVSEQMGENLTTQLVYGASPVEHLTDTGLLGEGFTAVHATHLSEVDLDLMGRRVLAPASARRPSATSPTASARLRARRAWRPDQPGL